MKRRALIHITDLYHPPQDPDDHVDLATLYALEEIDLRAVILDPSRRALRGELGGKDQRRDPGIIPVAQLNFLTGRSIPCAAGPIDVLRHPADTAADRPRHEQAGIGLILKTLSESRGKVTISVVGSVRTLTAAFNREPELLKRKVARVLLNAGSSGGYVEWNVELDRAAYVGLMRSGLPIDWYPCAGDTGPFESGDRNTYWKASQQALFAGLPPPLCAWFGYGFTHDPRGDIVGALRKAPDADAWSRVLAQSRNLWSTASLIREAGRVLCLTPGGWRFVPAAERCEGEPVERWTLEPVTVTVGDDGLTRWVKAAGRSSVRLFKRHATPRQDAAMAEALNHLLKGLREKGVGDDFST